MILVLRQSIHSNILVDNYILSPIAYAIFF